MKLYKALELLEDDDSKYITIAGISKEDFHIRKIGLSIKIYTSESFRKKSKTFEAIFFLPTILSFENDSFIVHTEPKFKVGDLVSVRQIIEGERFGRVVEISNNAYRLDFDRNTMYPNFYVEPLLTLIMPAQELAEKLGGSE